LLSCKLGIEDTDVASGAKSHGVFLFDFSPVKKPVDALNGKRPTIDKVAEHHLALAKSMWELSNAKVAVTMGTLPAASIIHFFPERIRVVCDTKYTLTKDGGMPDGAC
jgi:hypothetical protein